MTVEEMKKRKRELGFSYEQISERSGVPLGTVQKIFGGVTKAPRYDTLCALERMFEESGFLKKRQGEYTLDDYYALPEERRVELINGVFYDMASPSSVHQGISMFISNALFNFIKESKGGCRVYSAPLDVQLNKDNKTMVQPDILVVCKKENYRNGVIYGAPDFVIEILSDSTRSKDMVLKLNKYCEAGVREYWTVDPKRREVTVFTFGEEIETKVYGGTSVVPVGIYDGRCSIDLEELFAYAGAEE